MLGAILLGFGVMTAAGMSPIGAARAAEIDSIDISVSIPEVMAVTNGCSGVVGIAVALGSIAYSATCTVAYGSTTDPTQKLTLADSDATAPFQGTIPDTLADCAPLGGASDEAGVHITGTANDSSIMAGWATTCTTASAAGANTYFRATPTAAVDACNSVTTSVSDHQCSFQWAVSESGNNLSAASTYVGTAKFTVVDI